MNFSSIRKFIDSSTWVIFFAAVIFSFMTVVAQNALPGDILYTFKLGYERVMLASSRALNKQVDVQIEFVARRFSETTKVLTSQYGSESLGRLNAEVESTAYTITMIEDPEDKQVAAKKYVAQLNVIKSGLSQEKQKLVFPESPSQPLSPTPTNYIFDMSDNSPKVTPTTVISASQNETIVGEIDSTQQIIEETIEEMEDIAETPQSEPIVLPTPTTSETPTSTPASEPSLSSDLNHEQSSPRGGVPQFTEESSPTPEPEKTNKMVETSETQNPTLTVSPTASIE